VEYRPLAEIVEGLNALEEEARKELEREREWGIREWAVPYSIEVHE
jgi:hypothetical protein